MDFSGYMDELMAVPLNLLFGWIVGLLVPVTTLAGIVAGIYFFTRQIPFITQIEEEGGERRLVVELVEPEEARGLFQRGREAARAFGEEIRTELESEQ